jgi:hypothetical protein
MVTTFRGDLCKGDAALDFFLGVRAGLEEELVLEVRVVGVQVLPVVSSTHPTRG